MTKKELNEKRKEIKKRFANLEKQFEDSCRGAWIKMAEKNLEIPTGLSELETQRVDMFRHPEKYTQRKWFAFTALYQADARKGLYPVRRWMDMIMVIDFHFTHFKHHQKQWKKAITMRQMNAHNKISEQIADNLENNLRLLKADREAWEAI